ncbi:hypothetical protein [Gordonia hankookensis]|uniref:Uncharacterized protein n=1 Tax=Gordonia hankookensis TaxID=589403 RepID=A0ABR7WCV4_9ACTN|nr:hypothetical protein [Gordonia hankookensis]MBD1320620.1 hypothetical protein [Gordonia hankookensis]
MSAIALAVAVAIAAPAAAASAEPDRSPHKSVPGGTNNDNHVRHGAEPDRSPHKSVPGGNNNDNHPRVGAEPDRSPHKFSPGETGNQIAPITPGGTDRSSDTPHDNPDQAGPEEQRSQPSDGGGTQSPSATRQSGPSSSSPEPGTTTSPTPDTTAPETDTPAPTPAQPSTTQPTAPPRSTTPDAPFVDARSIGGSPDLPGSAIEPGDCPNGCIVSDHHTGTTRVFDLDDIPAGGDPRTTPRVIDPDANDGATGTFSKNLITPNPMTNQGVGVPLPQGSEPNTAPGAGGQVNPGRQAGTIDVQGRSQMRLRVVRAVPDGSHPVRTVGGDGVAVHYHYEYEAQSLKGVDVNGIHLFGKGKWAPVNQSQVDDLAKKGVPLPSVR